MILANIFIDAIKHGALMIGIAFLLIFVGGCGHYTLHQERVFYETRPTAGPVEIIFKSLWVLGFMILMPQVVIIIYRYLTTQH